MAPANVRGLKWALISATFRETLINVTAWSWTVDRATVLNPKFSKTCDPLRLCVSLELSQ